MSKVFLYSRVSTDQQTLEQQERTVYEWLNSHGMKVDRVVSDEGVSGGVSFADRKLGKELLPIMKEGDLLIVSEISRLGRSMFDLSKLIHTELKPRKIRLVVVSMGIDLRCDKMTAIDELILNNFSFAAQLEKQLISERTLSALQVKRKQGVKLGGASDKWRETYDAMPKDERKKVNMKRGASKNSRYLESKDVTTFLRVLKKTFPNACENEEAAMWDWSQINTKGENKVKIISYMRDFKEIDGSGKLFVKWDFTQTQESLRVKVASFIQHTRRALTYKIRESELANTYINN